VNKTRTLVAVAALAGGLAAPIATGTADASSGITHRGSCSGHATWKLTAKHDNGRIEVEWQVDSNRAGQVWSVRLRDNGVLFFSGNRTTQAPSGSFTVRRLTANRAGADVIRARSVHNTQVCAGSVTI